MMKLFGISSLLFAISCGGSGMGPEYPDAAAEPDYELGPGEKWPDPDTGKCSACPDCPTCATCPAPTTCPPIPPPIECPPPVECPPQNECPGHSGDEHGNSGKDKGKHKGFDHSKHHGYQH